LASCYLSFLCCLIVCDFPLCFFVKSFLFNFPFRVAREEIQNKRTYPLQLTEKKLSRASFFRSLSTVQGALILPSQSMDRPSAVPSGVIAIVDATHMCSPLCAQVQTAAGGLVAALPSPLPPDLRESFKDLREIVWSLRGSMSAYCERAIAGADFMPRVSLHAALQLRTYFIQMNRGVLVQFVSDCRTAVSKVSFTRTPSHSVMQTLPPFVRLVSLWTSCWPPRRRTDSTES
jgi:hypothetical protein